MKFSDYNFYLRLFGVTGTYIDESFGDFSSFGVMETGTIISINQNIHPDTFIVSFLDLLLVSYSRTY